MAVDAAVWRSLPPPAHSASFTPILVSLADGGDDDDDNKWQQNRNGSHSKRTREA